MFLGALATAAATTFAVPANAVVYSSGFDPLSFSGTGFFQFDNHCETDNGGFGTYTQADCNVLFQSASVDMVDKDSFDVTIGTGHLNFGPSTDIDFIYISGGLLVGVDSGLFGPAFTGTSCSGTLCNGDPWWIQWQNSFVTSTSDPVFLYTGFCEGEFCEPNGTASAIAFNVTFTRQSDGNGAPEPGTLGLILGGVGAAWWARRRKAAA
jgi:hypothetical protein